MHTENIKRLAEADKKAIGTIQQARKERDELRIQAKKEAQRFEESLVQQKEKEVEEYRVKMNAELKTLEASVDEVGQEALQAIKQKASDHKDIVKAISNAVVGK